MADQEKIVEVVTNELEKEFAKQKADLEQQNELKAAIAALEKKKDDLLSTIKEFSLLPVPLSPLDFYVQNRGKIWASKIIAVDGDQIEVTRNGRTLMRISPYPIHGVDSGPDLSKGLYKFVLFIVPQPLNPKDIKDNQKFTDDYGNTILINQSA